MLALLKEMAILSYCNNKNIGNILGIYFNPQDRKVWII